MNEREKQLADLFLTNILTYLSRYSSKQKHSLSVLYIQYVSLLQYLDR